MHPLKILATVLSAGLIVAGLCAGVAAMAAPLNLEPVRLTDDPVPTFTRIVTITLQSGAAAQTALTSDWQQTILGFPVGPGGFTTTLALPADATAITATVNNGQFTIFGANIQFVLFPGQVDFAWSYRTAQQVRRSGNQFQIDQSAGSNTYFRYMGTILYPSPYEYVGSINFAPDIVTTDTLHWDLVVLEVTTNTHTFNASSWLVDPRLDQPDLSFTTAAISIESGLNPPVAHLTATIRNNNNLNITSTIAILEFYDRASPSVPPGGPLDHVGGWCGTEVIPNCPILPTFANPIPALGPGTSTTVFMTYPLTQPGLRDYYFQIDTFGGVNGLNSEYDETNNVYTLTRNVAIDYLAGVTISGPVTGTPGLPIAFHAQVLPALAASRPVTYVWMPDPVGGQGTAQADYIWADGQAHTITVTARNSNQVIVTGTHVISMEVPVSGGSLIGPGRVSIDSPHAYRVSALPVTATQPISYRWSPTPDQGQFTAVATYTLLDLGPQLLAVQLNNSIGPAVTVTHLLTVVPSLAAAGINGPAVGRVNTTYFFNATFDPPDAVLPVTYLWSPAPITGQGTNQATYSWPTIGPQTIGVAISNDSGPVTASHTIQLAVPLSGVSLNGPAAVSINIPHVYTASIQPAGGTPPASYLWTPPPDAGQGTSLVTYTLITPGPHLLSVALTDATGQMLSAIRTVTASLPLAAVALSGPNAGYLNNTYHFTATLDPVDAAPALYDWQPTPRSGQGTAFVTYQWLARGPQTITVTAHNDSGSVVGQHTLDIAGGYVYLPLVRK